MVVLLALALAALASATPSKRAMTVHERKVLPRAFTRVKAAPSDELLTMRLALQSRDHKGLVDALYSVSIPSSPSYGKFLNSAEINAFLAPPDDALASVNEWLAANNISATPVSAAGDWLEFTISTSHANKVFDADFTVFKHADTGETSVRTLQYSLPTSLRSSIAVLFPGTSFWSSKSIPKFTEISADGSARDLHVARRQSIPSSCLSTITPTCIQALYGYPTAAATIPSNQLAVSGFIEQFANQQDLTAFLRVNRPSIVNATFKTQFVDNGTNPQARSQAGIEANLDIQYTIGLATRVPTTFISVGENQTDQVFGFQDIIEELISQEGQPQVLTTSYGADEPELSPDLSIQLCYAYAALGAKGTSILFASGDGGVAGSRNNPCTTFVPTFPSGCPYITTVGATTGIPETSAAFSSGGFSEVFDQPFYQSAAVAAYFAQIGSLNANLFNPGGRGFPDVSAMGDNVLITWMGLTGTVGGTSCSSPILASAIALINDLRATTGLPALGFLNPFLYANPQAFNDITTGSNPGCGTNGFPALPGWDPVTGLGTPNFAALAAAAGV